MTNPSQRTSGRGVAAVLPAFNAGRHLGAVLEGIRKHLKPEEILVVDDGSADDTSAVAERTGVGLVKHPVNQGKGAALATGLRWARESSFLAVINLDADGQHDPDEIPLFIETFLRGDADLIVGTRLGDPRGMPGLRLWTNRVTSWILSLRVGQRVEDSQCGYRLIRTSLIDPDELVTSRYDTESEILIRAGMKKARFAFLPIKSLYGDETSSIHPVRDAARFLGLLWRSLFWGSEPRNGRS